MSNTPRIFIGIINPREFFSDLSICMTFKKAGAFQVYFENSLQVYRWFFEDYRYILTVWISLIGNNVSQVF